MPYFLHEIYIDIFHFSIFVSINLSLIYLFIYLSMCRYLLMNPSYQVFDSGSSCSNEDIWGTTDFKPHTVGHLQTSDLTL